MKKTIGWKRPSFLWSGTIVSGLFVYVALGQLATGQHGGALFFGILAFCALGMGASMAGPIRA
jgi:hypothetical protein